MTIDGVTYGSGTASSKKLAKNRAGKGACWGHAAARPGGSGPLTHSLGRAHQEAEWEKRRRGPFVRSVGGPAPPAHGPPCTPYRTHSALRCLSLGAICGPAQRACSSGGPDMCASREAWGCRSSTTGAGSTGALAAGCTPAGASACFWEPASPSWGGTEPVSAGVASLPVQEAPPLLESSRGHYPAPPTSGLFAGLLRAESCEVQPSLDTPSPPGEAGLQARFYAQGCAQGTHAGLQRVHAPPWGPPPV